MTDPKTLTHLSKFLSFVLRHEPHAIGLVLDRNGWAEIDVLVERSRAHGKALSHQLIEEIVATSPKQRFALSEDRLFVRANQGHSIDVELGYEPAEPPEVLFHGTVASCLSSIRIEGLKKMERHHVHLSPDFETAQKVGMRRGKSIVLRIAALQLHRDGHVFFVSQNRVWLTESVPADYIELIQDPIGEYRSR